MASQSSHYSPFDLSSLRYYEKAPHDEDENHQPSWAEDISTRLADDLAYMLSGNEDGQAQPCTSDVHIENGKRVSPTRSQLLIPITTAKAKMIQSYSKRRSVTFVAMEIHT